MSTSRASRMFPTSFALVVALGRASGQPSYINVLCNNECFSRYPPHYRTAYGRDGGCDDGGPGSTWDGCKLGSDCEDCGGSRTGPPGAPPPMPAFPPVSPIGDNDQVIEVPVTILTMPLVPALPATDAELTKKLDTIRLAVSRVLECGSVDPGCSVRMADIQPPARGASYNDTLLSEVIVYIEYLDLVPVTVCARPPSPPPRKTEEDMDAPTGMDSTWDGTGTFPQNPASGTRWPTAASGTAGASGTRIDVRRLAETPSGTGMYPGMYSGTAFSASGTPGRGATATDAASPTMMMTSRSTEEEEEEEEDPCTTSLVPNPASMLARNGMVLMLTGQPPRDEDTKIDPPPLPPPPPTWWASPPPPPPPPWAPIDTGCYARAPVRCESASIPDSGTTRCFVSREVCADFIAHHTPFSGTLSLRSGVGADRNSDGRDEKYLVEGGSLVLEVSGRSSPLSRFDMVAVFSYPSGTDIMASSYLDGSKQVATASLEPDPVSITIKLEKDDDNLPPGPYVAHLIRNTTAPDTTAHIRRLAPSGTPGASSSGYKIGSSVVFYIATPDCMPGGKCMASTRPVECSRVNCACKDVRGCEASGTPPGTPEDTDAPTGTEGTGSGTGGTGSEDADAPSGTPQSGTPGSGTPSSGTPFNPRLPSLSGRRLDENGTDPNGTETGGRTFAAHNLTSLQEALLADGMDAVFVLQAMPSYVYRSWLHVFAQFPSPPPSPNPPPPPRPPPQPPASPPGLCSNDCNTLPNIGRPGSCDDGGAGSETNTCDIGTDCADCGVRQFCTSCTAECQAIGAQDIRIACLESMLANRRCDVQCNNRACGFDAGDCTQTQVLDECEAVQETGSVDFSTSPALVERRDALGYNGLVLMNFQLDFDPIRLSLSTEFNQMVMSLEFVYTFQWRDARLWSSPCVGALSSASSTGARLDNTSSRQTSMLSMSRAAARSDIARNAQQNKWNLFWTPLLDADGLSPGFDRWDDEVTFGFEWRVDEPAPEDEWLAGVVPSAAQRTCINCVTWEAESEVSLLQEFSYFYYPFDVQLISARFKVAGAHLYTCTNGTGALGLMGLTQANAAEMLLGPESSREWSLVDDFVLPGGGMSAFRVRHAEWDDGSLDLSSCVLDVKVRREWVGYGVRSMLATGLVVVGSLMTALLMHAEEHIGDRMAVLFIAFLILVTNMQTELGLGVISRLLWIDLFNLLQLFMIIVAIFQTLLVFGMIRSGRQKTSELAVHIDNNSKWGILALYCCFTVPALMWGASAGDAAQNRFAGALFGVLVLALLVLFICSVRISSSRLDKRRLRALARLTATDASKELEWELAVKNVFDVFDQDGTGDMDSGEVRQLLKLLYPGAQSLHYRKVMALLRDVADNEGHLELDTFQDALVIADEYMRDNLAEYAKLRAAGANAAKMHAAARARRKSAVGAELAGQFAGRASQLGKQASEKALGVFSKINTSWSRRGTRSRVALRHEKGKDAGASQGASHSGAPPPPLEASASDDERISKTEHSVTGQV